MLTAAGDKTMSWEGAVGILTFQLGRHKELITLMPPFRERGVLFSGVPGGFAVIAEVTGSGNVSRKKELGSQCKVWNVVLFWKEGL